jgi:hypothetical protein
LLSLGDRFLQLVELRNHVKLYIPVTEEKLELLNLPDASTGSIESVNATFACLSIGSHSDYIQKVTEEPDLMEKYLKEEKFSVEFEAEKGVKSHRVLVKTAEYDYEKQDYVLDIKAYASHHYIAEKIGRSPTKVSSYLNCLKSTDIEQQPHFVEIETVGNKKYWRINRKAISSLAIELFEKVCYKLGENEKKYLDSYLQNLFTPESLITEIETDEGKQVCFTLLEELFKSVEMDADALRTLKKEKELFGDPIGTESYVESYPEEIVKTLEKIDLWRRKTNPNFLSDEGDLLHFKLEEDGELTDAELSAFSVSAEDLRNTFSEHDFS